jgi:hypothetical protein
VTTRMISLRLTEEEQELLEWILIKEGLPSHSEVIRTSLLRTAIHLGLQPGSAALSVQSRAGHTPRRRRAKSAVDAAHAAAAKASSKVGGNRRACEGRPRERKSR